MTKIQNLKYGLIGIFVFCGSLFVFFPWGTQAAVLTVQPSSGTFEVGGTFEVQILLDTEGQAINALDINLLFPPDKLQIISPSVGRSIIDIWTAPPRFDNAKGVVNLQGGMPDGITVSRGVVSTISFRARGTGSAIVRFGEQTKVLLHDGSGTDVLRLAQRGIYTFILPPPQGPDVFSETHPDQTKWYPNPTVLLGWTAPESVLGFSYTLNSSPVSLPDNDIDSEKNSVAYRDLSSGTHYFHIKAMNKDGIWGGITHFSVKIDKDLPADFKMEIHPGKITTSRDMMFSFQTTDAHSGLERYEYKIIPLRKHNSPLYVEALSPQVVNLEPGTYDIAVRAYDRAGNFREVIERIRVVRPLTFWATNLWFLLFLLLLVIILILIARKIYLRHLNIAKQHQAKELPEPLRQKLDELEKYRSKYGALVLLLAILSGLAFFTFTSSVGAQGLEEFAPPYVSAFPKQISNEEIFYLGGRAESSGTEIIIYLQNLKTGETFSYSEISGKNGEWFYRHPSFLSVGQYIVWTQSKLGETISPPSPQLRLNVNPTALQFGASRLSYEALYGLLALLLFAMLLALLTFITVHARHARRKYNTLIREIREAEEAVRIGFRELKKDIEAELAIIHKAKLSKALSQYEREKEEHLLADLAQIERYISKEVEDIERAVGR